MQKVTAFLWFDKGSEEAMNFYVSVFNGAPVEQPESKIISIDRFPDRTVDENMAGLEGRVSSGLFELAGQQFRAFDGGPTFKFNEAISFYVECKTQAEIDYYWEKLSAVPESEACGWLKDKYGLSWQIAPTIFNELLSDPNSEKSGRAFQAMMKMKKLDIAELKRAFDGQ